MRMWNIDTTLLCNKHLLGEHVEMHMFAGTLKKGISINGYLKNGLVNLGNIKNRHDLLAKEMEKRNMKHKSKLKRFKEGNQKTVNIDKSLLDLKHRCKDCKRRIEKK